MGMCPLSAVMTKKYKISQIAFCIRYHTNLEGITCGDVARFA